MGRPLGLLEAFLEAMVAGDLKEKAGAWRNPVLFPTLIYNDLHLSPFKIITKVLLLHHLPLSYLLLSSTSGELIKVKALPFKSVLLLHHLPVSYLLLSSTSGELIKIYKALLEVLQLPVDSRPKAVDRRKLSRTQITGTNSRKIPKTKLQSIGLGLQVIEPLHNLASTRESSCNKPGHIKGDCPKNKKEKHKKIHKFKKPKAMVATWSDEDSSEKEEEEKSSSSESEEICFMANSSDGKVAELNEEKEIFLNSIDELKLASQKATHEFKELSEKLEMENKDKQQKIEEIKILENQLKEKDEVIETFTKCKDNLEALLGAKMKSISHGLGFNKEKPKKDKSGEKRDKAPLIKFVKGPSLENIEIKQTSSKITKISKTQNQKKSTRSTQLPDRSTPVHKKKDFVTAVSTPVKKRPGRHYPHLVSTHSSARSTLTSSSVDTYPSQGDSRCGRRLRVFLFLRDIAPSKPFFYARSTPWPPSTFEYGNHSTFFPPPTHPCLPPFIPSSPSSALPLSLASMAPKKAPRRGARSRATARPIPAEEAPPTERRSKRRHDPAEQPGPSSASPSYAKRGRTSSVRGRGSANPRRRILVSSPDPSEGSSSSSSEATPSKSVSEGKMILKPRAVDLADTQLAAAFPEIHSFFSFQTWLPFISEFRIIYPRLVQEFYLNLECTDDGYKSEVKGVVIDMPITLAATIFKIPDEGADYHSFEFDLHEAYNILTGLQADESDPRQTHVTKFNTNTFPPVLRLIHHILTTIITPQGGGRDRLTDIQRFVIYCMKKNIKVNHHVIMYQIISETTRKDLHRSLPYAANLTPVFKHFGVSLVNEKSQSIPKSNIYYFKHVQKFMGFRLEGDQVRRGPVVVEAPVPEAPEAVIPPPEDQPPANEDQPQAH
ncbi:hypothetical protein Taro_037600 [Colocasia esculenta]|uniref:Putative plant transposon protein domain-containing protein n=1 Tax=Colocasia esculenta TaxID=4460 RepID=A0A843WA87_COLES|nr:hypothetical protein [Colocasia esculenta]